MTIKSSIVAFGPYKFSVLVFPLGFDECFKDDISLFLKNKGEEKVACEVTFSIKDVTSKTSASSIATIEPHFDFGLTSFVKRDDLFRKIGDDPLVVDVEIKIVIDDDSLVRFRCRGTRFCQRGNV